MISSIIGGLKFSKFSSFNWSSYSGERHPALTYGQGHKSLIYATQFAQLHTVTINNFKSWAGCLARVFEVYPLVCPKCRLEMKPVAVILNDKELVRLLTHLGLPAEFPRFRPVAQASLYEHACGPPDEQCQLDPRVDLYEGIDPLPADD